MTQARKIFFHRAFVSLLSGMLLVPLIVQAQLRSIMAYTEYSSVMTKRLAVQNADAVGAGVDIVYSLVDHVTVGLRAGYYLYSIRQTDQLNQWGWRFWNDRYLNKIQSDMRADPSLSSEIGSIQKMDLIPVSLHADYTFDIAEQLTVEPTVGAGVAFFQRRLFADETWTKVFPDANYSFTYSFRNFAPAKKGNPVFGTVGIDVRYHLFSSAGIFSSMQYTRYLETKNMFGYNEFIFTDEFGVRLGLEFFY